MICNDATRVFPSSGGAGLWRKIRVAKDGAAYEGAWREVGRFVHVESVFGRVSGEVAGHKPDRVAEALFSDLLERWAGTTRREPPING